MSVFRWCVTWIGRTRPVNTPTAMSLLAASGLLAAALLLPDHASERASAATDVRPLSVSPVRPQQSASLRDRLVVGLQARLNSEVDFVELVELRVRTGQLPQRLVDETFFWARQRASAGFRGRARRPIIYFQPAMRARAQRLNVDL